MNTVNFSVKKLKEFCEEAFNKFGFTMDEAKKITDVLLLADLFNVKSHGTQRLVRYHKAIENGSIRIDSKPEIVFETPVSTVIDGHSGMGQLVSIFATELAIKKAKESGMAFVTVRNSNHFGIAGYYTKMACDQGLMAIATTNSESIAVHTNSRQAILGSNPIAFAMPAEPIPFWFDAATTVVPKGKLEVYNKEDKALGYGWAVDENGQVCTDAEHALCCIDDKLGGGILTLGGAGEDNGGHKGYGYSMMCELLCSITSCGKTSNHHIRAKGQGAGTCHSFIVIDPKIFGDAEEIKRNLSVFLQELRDAKRAEENVPIYTHGEKEYISYNQRMQEGIDVNISTVAEMLGICEYLNMDKRKYFAEDIDISSAKKSSYDKIYK